MVENKYDELRDVLVDANIAMKFIPYDNNEGGYFIGNCNLDNGLKNTVLRFMPPDENGDGAKIVILNATYNNGEFEQFLEDVNEFDGLNNYFHGLCNMDIRTMQTLFKFFPDRFGRKNVLVIQLTQKREEGKRIENPVEVSIFMRSKKLQSY
jgi:hypothetical protein